jgi:NADPH:quinone reductase-like Zn-dependent oxidoreductase
VLLAYAPSEVIPIMKKGMGWNFCPNELGAKATREIVELVRNGSVRPVIGKLIDFEDIPREIQALFDRKTVGRTIAKLY